MEVDVRILGPNEVSVLNAVAPDVFDDPVNLAWAAEFLADPRHHLAVAVASGVVVGMASAVHYIHPDKPPELWVNEVGVSEPYQNRGIGRRLLKALFARGLAVGCAKGWVGTAVSNVVARRLYEVVGGVEDSEPFVMVSFDLEQDAEQSLAAESR